MSALLTPVWLVRVAVAAVWLYEGVWCKLLGRERRQLEIVSAVPYLSTGAAAPLLKLLGAVETGIGVWVLTGAFPVACAVTQTLLLITLNASGLLVAAKLIHDPGGMVVKNFAFLVLAWVSASLPGWR